MPSRHELASTAVNAQQTAAWNGPEGANWAKHSSGRVADGDLIEPLLDAAAIAIGDRVLDIGCGTGELARQAARRTTSGWTLGIDLSEQMIDQARYDAQEQEFTNVGFEVGDAQTHPFDAGSFNVALSHFGTMFFAEPVQAFRNIARAVRPGGRILFVCPQSMDRCDWYTIPLAALLGHAPSDKTAPSAMFSLAEPATVSRTLTAAGLSDISLTHLDQPLWFGADVSTAVEGFLGSGPVRAICEREPTLTPDQVRARLEVALTPYLTNDGVRIPGAYWLIEATSNPEPRE